jgi:hypothetical protein
VHQAKIRIESKGAQGGPRVKTNRDGIVRRFGRRKPPCAVKGGWSWSDPSSRFGIISARSRVASDARGA